VFPLTQLAVCGDCYGLSQWPEPDAKPECAPLFFNRYMYTYNDPVNTIDPDGEAGIIGGAIGGFFGGVVSYGAQVYKDVKNGASLREAATSPDAVKAAATGALTGALVGSGAGLVTTAVGATLIGGGVEATAGVVTGEGVDAVAVAAAAFNNLVGTAAGVGAGKLAEKAVSGVVTGVRASGAVRAAADGAISSQSANAIASEFIDLSGTVAGEIAGYLGGTAFTFSTVDHVPSEIIQETFEELQ